MSMWYGLKGVALRANGTAGTVTLPAGAKVLQIHAYASSASTIKVFDDSADITLPASSGWFVWQANHTNCIAPTDNPTIVFTSTAAFMVEYVLDGTGGA